MLVDRLNPILNIVNERLPQHGRGIIDPEQMSKQGAANCFGRLATIGSALVAEGIMSIEDLYLLTSKAHGQNFGPGDFWFGHSALIIDDGGEDKEFVDVIAGRNAFTRGPGFLRQIGWTTETDEVILKVYEGCPPDSITDAVDVFEAFPFPIGLKRYQEGHPFYGSRPGNTIEDYARFYASFVIR